jgi:hypothetical protein
VETIETTLFAIEGKKPGEAIGNYGRSIVFLPREVKPGQTVRVCLVEIRVDTRGRMMYRGVPAPDIDGEKWKDHGDGRASCIKIKTDWQGNAREVGEIETRLLAKREGAPIGHFHFSVAWGISQASSFVEEWPSHLIPLEEEVVSGSDLVWQKVGERSEQLPTVRHPLARIVVQGGAIWDGKWSEPVFKPSWTLHLALYWANVSGNERSFSVDYTWGSLPTWYQAEILSKFPLCSCGRNRRNLTTSSPDGFAKCETCRGETPCGGCGAKGRVEQLSSGRIVCSACKPLVAQEELVERLLSREYREEFALQALELLDGECVPREAGEIILRSSVAHMKESWDRDRLLEKWSGYLRYYFTSAGVYGSRFSPQALQILCHFASASGRGLVELVAWLVGDGRSSDDYYVRTQEKGESLKPALTEYSLQCLSVATRLFDFGVPKPAPKHAAPKADAKPASAEQVTTSLDALKAKFGGGKKR